MHRSGTSLTAQLCHELGWRVTGPEDFLRQGNQYNPQGYWETSDLVTINRRILYALGGDWHVPPHFRSHWEESRELLPLKKRAMAFIQQITSPQATWKDPRLTLTLPFWKPLVRNARYIVCIRNPLDVALSLSRRDHMTQEHALSLWLLYTTQALLHTQQARRLILFYEDLMGPKAPTQLERLQRFLERDGTQTIPLPVIRPELAHGQHGLSSPAIIGKISPLAQEMWNALLRWREQNFTSDHEVLALARSFPIPRTPWHTMQKYRLNFWMRLIKMQLLEGPGS
ncbi:sulfotransferase family protein [Sulfobacillus thermosulfidooxidans]|uniref:sulfotransferase family protein n=1 Tax=Sulfobacillus thermosulfidooxidans TaxID=28034 RepID=UPI0006B56EDE|nr:sulfotransferase family protein [Sulfobacillus thermosulfidooxidans]